MLRFANRLGYRGFPDFQQALRDDLDERSASPIELYDRRQVESVDAEPPGSRAPRRSPGHPRSHLRGPRPGGVRAGRRPALHARGAGCWSRAAGSAGCSRGSSRSTCSCSGPRSRRCPTTTRAGRGRRGAPPRRRRGRLRLPALRGNPRGDRRDREGASCVGRAVHGCLALADLERRRRGAPERDRLAVGVRREIYSNMGRPTSCARSPPARPRPRRVLPQAPDLRRPVPPVVADAKAASARRALRRVRGGSAGRHMNPARPAPPAHRHFGSATSRTRTNDATRADTTEANKSSSTSNRPLDNRGVPM